MRAEGGTWKLTEILTCCLPPPNSSPAAGLGILELFLRARRQCYASSVEGAGATAQEEQGLLAPGGGGVCWLVTWGVSPWTASPATSLGGFAAGSEHSARLCVAYPAPQRATFQQGPLTEHIRGLRQGCVPREGCGAAVGVRLPVCSGSLCPAAANPGPQSSPLKAPWSKGCTVSAS